jgi:hypothetical protein
MGRKNEYKTGITYGKSIVVMWHCLKLTCSPRLIAEYTAICVGICDISKNQYTQLKYLHFTVMILHCFIQLRI